MASAGLIALTAPALAADNGPIVYEHGGDLYSIAPNGSDQTRLTKTKKAFETDPAISSNGRFVVYDRGREAKHGGVNDSTTSVWTMRIDGSRQTALTGQGDDNKDDIFAASSPSFSPSGKLIAFQVTSYYFNLGLNVRDNKIYTMRTDGSHKKLLSKNQDDFGPVFSPDNQIVFHQNKRRNDVFSMTATGKNRKEVPELAYLDFDIGFAPDAKTLVFARGFKGDPGCSDIYSVGADGANLAQLSTGTACEEGPAISPDGTGLAFASWTKGERCSADGEIIVAAVSGADPKKIANGCAPAWAAGR